MARVLSTLLVVTCIASTAVGFIPSRALKAAVAVGRQTSTTSHFVPLARPPLKRHTRAPTVRRAGEDDNDKIPQPDDDDYKRAEERAQSDSGEMKNTYEMSDSGDDIDDYSQLDALMDEIWNENDLNQIPGLRAVIEMPDDPNPEDENGPNGPKGLKLDEVIGADVDEIADDILERVELVEDMLINQMGIAKKVMNETSGELELEANMDDIPEAERWPKMLEILNMLETKYEITEEDIQEGYDEFVEQGWGKAIGLDDELRAEGGGVETQIDELVKLQYDEDKKKMLQKKKKKEGKKKPTSDDA